MRMCELLVGLPDVEVIGVDDPEPGRLVVVVEPREARPTCERVWPSVRSPAGVPSGSASPPAWPCSRSCSTRSV